jgi:hypothetical protein
VAGEIRIVRHSHELQSLNQFGLCATGVVPAGEGMHLLLSLLQGPGPAPRLDPELNIMKSEIRLVLHRLASGFY